MKPIILFLFTFCAISFSQEWVSLFNGQDMENWTIKNVPADDGRAWFRVVDDCIEAFSLNVDEHDYIWLYSQQEYDNFILKFKFQAFRTSPGNSGVQIRSRYDDETGWLDGPQIDINPPGPWRTGMMWDETRGNQSWLWPQVPKDEWVDESMANPQMPFYYVTDDPDWNEMQITANGTHITIELNGIEIVNWDGAGILDDDIHKAHNVGMSGHIALQIHRNDKVRIRFKDIFIKELP